MPAALVVAVMVGGLSLILVRCGEPRGRGRATGVAAAEPVQPVSARVAELAAPASLDVVGRVELRARGSSANPLRIKADTDTDFRYIHKVQEILERKGLQVRTVRVLSVEEGAVVLDRGRKARVRAGEVFDVYRGRVLVGAVRVESVEECTARATIVHTEDALEAGDLASTGDLVVTSL